MVNFRQSGAGVRPDRVDAPSDFFGSTAGVPVRTPAVARLLDITFAVAALLTVLPVLAAIAAALLVVQGGPVLASETRTGRGGRRFRRLRFRTLPPHGTGGRPTALGALLRGSGLDELPQLLNVLRGEMAVFGPGAR